MSEDDLLVQQALELKNMGYSSKFMCPINRFLAIAEKAKRYDAMPQPVKDAAELLRAGQ